MHRLRHPFYLALLAFSLGLARLAANGTATDIYGLNYTGYNNYTLLAGGSNDPNWQVTYADVEGQSYTGNSQYTGAAYVIDDSPYISSESYVQNSSVSQWITAPGATTTTSGTSTDSGGNYLPGNGTTGSYSAEYIYTMTFSITGTGSGTVTNDVAINLTIAADDDYAIYVNGATNTHSHGSQSATYGDLLSTDTASITGSNAWTNSTMAWLANYTSGTLSNNAGFVIGTNTISIVVTNSNAITDTASTDPVNPSGLLVYEIGGEGLLVNGAPVPEVGAWLPVAGALGLFAFLVWRRKEWLPAVSAEFKPLDHRV
jgi:hypothetical protein